MMIFRIKFVLFALALFYLTTVIGSEERKCSPTNLNIAKCLENEMCMANGTSSGVCKCKIGYIRSSNSQTVCLPKPVVSVLSPASTASTPSTKHIEMAHSSSISTGTITAAVLVPLVLAVGGILIFIGQRYQWFERLQLLQGRHYEEVRIGQEDDEDDDPPLA